MWEALYKGDMSYRESIPEELWADSDALFNKLYAQIAELTLKVQTNFHKIELRRLLTGQIRKKECAEIVKTAPKWQHSLLFDLFNMDYERFYK